MRQFKELGIKPKHQNFTGEKINISRVFNKEIIIHEYRIVDSKYQKNTEKCMHLQIEIDNQMRVLFTGSGVLMDTITKVSPEDFPFAATIEKVGEHFEFR